MIVKVKGPELPENVKFKYENGSVKAIAVTRKSANYIFYKGVGPNGKEQRVKKDKVYPTLKDALTRQLEEQKKVVFKLKDDLERAEGRLAKTQNNIKTISTMQKKLIKEMEADINFDYSKIKIEL